MIFRSTRRAEPLGAQDRAVYVAAGDAVYQVSQVEARAAAHLNSIVITDSVRERVGPGLRAEPFGEITFDNATAPEKLFRVSGLDR